MNQSNISDLNRTQDVEFYSSQQVHSEHRIRESSTTITKRQERKTPHPLKVPMSKRSSLNKKNDYKEYITADRHYSVIKEIEEKGYIKAKEREVAKNCTTSNEPELVLEHHEDEQKELWPDNVNDCATEDDHRESDELTGAEVSVLMKNAASFATAMHHSDIDRHRHHASPPPPPPPPSSSSSEQCKSSTRVRYRRRNSIVIPFQRSLMFRKMEDFSDNEGDSGK